VSVPFYFEIISGTLTLKIAKRDVMLVTEQSGEMLMPVQLCGTKTLLSIEFSLVVTG
jgi:hypothetical protein